MVTTIETKSVYNIISSIKPHDALEGEHIRNTLTWIKSGAQIFRVRKPDLPNKHLVSYFLLYNPATQKILLVDHKKAKLWLPSGGHVEINEDPKDTVRRECLEELGIHADFLLPHPLFLTSTLTVGMTAGHTDVSLWYVLRGDSNTTYQFDTEEFNDIRWFSFDEIPYDKSDTHLPRFIDKFSKNSQS